MDNALKGYKLPQPVKAPAHEIAYHAERLCQALGLPFSTMMLRAVKTNRQIAEETVSYMKERKISSIRYFTKVYYSKLKQWKAG